MATGWDAGDVTPATAQLTLAIVESRRNRRRLRAIAGDKSRSSKKAFSMLLTTQKGHLVSDTDHPDVSIPVIMTASAVRSKAIWYAGTVRCGHRHLVTYDAGCRSGPRRLTSSHRTGLHGLKRRAILITSGLHRLLWPPMQVASARLLTDVSRLAKLPLQYGRLRRCSIGHGCPAGRAGL